MLSAGYDFRYGNVWLKCPDTCDPGVRAAIMMTPPVTNICELLAVRAIRGVGGLMRPPPPAPLALGPHRELLLRHDLGPGGSPVL